MKNKGGGQWGRSICDGMAVEMTHREIAEKLGISKQAVSQCEKRAIKKLRRNPRLRQLFEKLKADSARFQIAEPRAARAVNRLF